MKKSAITADTKDGARNEKNSLANNDDSDGSYMSDCKPGASGGSRQANTSSESIRPTRTKTKRHLRDVVAAATGSGSPAAGNPAGRSRSRSKWPSLRGERRDSKKEVITERKRNVETTITEIVVC